MSNLTDDLMKQLRFISEAANFYMSQKKQRLTGQQRVLAVLKLGDGLTQNYLREILDLSPSSIAELMKKMENNGDIIRKEDEHDKRSKLIYLTDAGRQKAEDNASLKNENYSEAFLAGLNDEEKINFSDYLKKISEGWDDDFKQNSEKFIDPTDRYQAMLNMREQMMDMRDKMTPEDIEHMRHEMREHMRHSPFTHGMPQGHCGHRGRRPDFRQDFWNGFRY
ncbi:MarR family winged helix-turn-helix transcriptional regulator [Companilactobacillus pabuli]|uniref:MarR family winged helix-turn-helix transcriptional regulator n=1 Tax=Companilactobacillus pabuli TaxID=2714036 RepID=UPI002417B4E2|nr:MarR family winged helix-turn-helix transcriptional regulator [Companilactobacillus pabuli]MDG5113842.1 MarR family winged helix-turn-helix transcriptional regulator [Companilactobacillus pabuli]